MFFSTKKFNREIEALKKLSLEDGLHPLQKEQVKQRVLASLTTETSPATNRYTRQERRHRLMRYIISILLGISMLGGTAFAAAGNAKPGDTLYPVKKAKEKIQISLTASDEAKVRLQTKFAEERLREFNEVSAGVTASTTASSTIGTDNHIKAEAQAEVELEHAVTNLQEVKAKLEAKGNATAAAAIGNTIIRLEDKIATASSTASTTDQTFIEIHGHGRGKNNGNDDGNDKVEINNNLQIKVNGDNGIRLNGKGRGKLEIDEQD